jgi:hypothetical protein
MVGVVMLPFPLRHASRFGPVIRGLPPDWHSDMVLGDLESLRWPGTTIDEVSREFHGRFTVRWIGEWVSRDEFEAHVREKMREKQMGSNDATETSAATGSA